MSQYYHRFRVIIGSPLWRLYLRWAYSKCISDLSKIDFIPDFNKRVFSVLLCGVGNEATADEFIKFVVSRNKEARVIIIDLGEEQIKAVRRLVQSVHPSYNIRIIQTDALEMKNFLKSNSIDWIETDGFLEYFDTDKLQNLLDIWKDILKQDGFITIREFASSGQLGTYIDNFRVWIANKWFGVRLYQHTKRKLENMFTKEKLRFISRPTFLPTFRRYSLIKVYEK